MRKQLRDKKRELIASTFVDAAEKVFCEHGFDRATMSQIAGAAGCAAGTLYLYFKSKEDLFNALVTKHAREIGRVIAATLDAAPDPRAGLREIQRQVAFYHADHPGFFRVFYTADLGPRPTIADCLPPDALAEYLESKQLEIKAAQKAQRLGLLRSDLPAEELIEFMHTSCMAAFARWATAKTQLDPEAQAERMWKLVSGGIIGTSDEGAVRAAAKGGRSSARSSGRLRS